MQSGMDFFFFFQICYWSNFCPNQIDLSCQPRENQMGGTAMPGEEVKTTVSQRRL